ncbi:uncharacterized protein BKA55DRAFT_526800 [Fusarium redolens]|uniref:Uncharacterized protein n=1 Tax=Fusarium redolens TaxID=48865 RepID=A0A9P9JQU9_FUSRE|nr:uncharacterized protein BKA55DRAFT_526800 [Fusarium redolens]KAH7228473.1 hypothetical protein BKA55DRAFT_526800 [Fusarium redolens]
MYLYLLEPTNNMVACSSVQVGYFIVDALALYHGVVIVISAKVHGPINANAIQWQSFEGHFTFAVMLMNLSQNFARCIMVSLYRDV